MADLQPPPVPFGYVHLGPADPPVLSVTGVDCTTVGLSWTANGLATSYAIYQGAAAGKEGLTPIATVPAGTTTYTVAGLTTGTPYFFTVAAYTLSAGYGQMSNEVTATPTCPPPPPPPPPSSMTWDPVQTVGYQISIDDLTVEWIPV